MSTKFIKCILLIATMFMFYSFDFDEAKGWIKAGSKPNSYNMGIDKGAGKDGNNCASIKSTDRKIEGFGTLMQNFNPDDYIGQKIRMTGSMRSKDVEKTAGFWLRIDNTDSKKLFDNMHDRPVKGNTEWTQYDIVLEVPYNASNIAFGALLNGTGQIWFDNIDFEVAGDSIPSTGKPKDKPDNLDFEK